MWREKIGNVRTSIYHITLKGFRNFSGSSFIMQSETELYIPILPGEKC